MDCSLLVGVLSLLALCQGAFYEGTIHKTEDGFVTLGNFCFDTYKTGNILLELRDKAGKTPTDVHVNLYSAEPDYWPEIYSDGSNKYKTMSCQERVSHAKPNGKRVEWLNGVWHTHMAVTQSTHPWFWYVTIESCSNPDGLIGLEYELHFLQGDVTHFHEEFGVNQDGLQTTYVVFFIFSTFYMIFHVATVYRMESIHPLIKMYTVIISIEYVSVILNLIHWATYIEDGQGSVFAQVLGDLMDLVARVLFMLMLMFLAKGWTISTERLEGKNLILGALGSVSAVYFLLKIWGWSVINSENINPPTSQQVLLYIIAGFWGVFAIWLAITSFRSYKSETDEHKRKLYVCIGLFYGAWFASLPLVIYITSIRVDPWVREKVHVAVDLCLTYLAFFVFSAITYPKWAAKFFEISALQPGLATTAGLLANENTSGAEYERL